MVFQVQINRRKQQFCLLGTKIKLFKVLEKQKWSENLSDCFAVCVHRGGSLNYRHDYFANTSGIVFLFLDRLTELFPTSSSLLQWINLRKTHYRQTQTYMLLYSSGVEFLMSPIKSVVSYYKKECAQIEVPDIHLLSVPPCLSKHRWRCFHSV